MLLVDTGVLVAATDRTDRHHVPCAELLEGDPGPIVTTAMVIAEAAYLIDRELGPKAEALLYQAIVDETVHIESLTIAEWRRIRTLVIGYSDLRLGGTDASLVAVAERLNVTTIATLNHRHFAVVRPKHAVSFELVP